ncbi:unnamed protein product, partial [Meganyctiphanes norvegica]
VPEETTVTDVSPVEDDPTKLTVTWDAPAYACTGSTLGEYSVSWTAEGDSKPTGSIDVPETTTTFVIDALLPCTTYTVSVAARSNTGLPGKSGPRSATTSVA